jgi:FlaA1/EpsC-like NDP-sugar epimerase
MEGIDFVIHAAALKQVDKAEYNPYEYIKTNILGAHNIIDASIYNNVKNVIALSTDKASSPINLYGATKLCSDKLFLSANNIKGNRKIKFSVVRYGNVMGSRGSVLPFFLKQKNLFPITDKRMTRFNITLEHSVEMVAWSLKNNLGGEIFVPKIPSYKIIDLATATNSKLKQKIIGIRPGEKIHEELISENDGIKTVEYKDYYAILNNFNDTEVKAYAKKKKIKRVRKNFSYNSYNEGVYLSIGELKKEIKKFKKSLVSY